MDAPEARGISRKLTDAKNGLNPPRIRIYPGNTVLSHRAAAPDSLTWTRRAPAEARGSPRMVNDINPTRIRIFPGNTVLELWVAVPDALTWTHR